MQERELKYSNYVAVYSSFFDFNFRFGIKNKELSEQNESADVADIFMSPQHAKTFLKILENNVHNYEMQYGEITVPFSDSDINDDELPGGVTDSNE